ncbi:MAG: hypothetical protein WB421_17505 [Terriglobales bacterium]
MKDGFFVCIDCGYVNKIPIYVMSYNDSYVQFLGNCSSGSSYKRTHYFNDKVNQWSCRDSNFSRHDLEEVKDFLPASGIVTKKTIRSALRLMGRAKDGENWIFIQCQLTNTSPPLVHNDLIEQMKRMFTGIEIAFEHCKPEKRKCMVHYNYIFVRILQFLNKPEFFKYFPLLKSKTKVRAIDDVWKQICHRMALDYTPLPTPKMFKNIGNIYGDSKKVQRGVPKHPQGIHKRRSPRRPSQVVELPHYDINQQTSEGFLIDLRDHS